MRKSKLSPHFVLAGIITFAVLASCSPSEIIFNILRGIWICQFEDKDACDCWDLLKGDICGRTEDPSYPPDNPDYPPGTDVDLTCAGPSMRVWSSFQMNEDSGYVWAEIARNGQAVSKGPAVFIDQASMTGLYLHVPIGGVNLNADDYSVNIYCAPNVESIGSLEKCIGWRTEKSFVHFTPEHVQMAAAWRRAPQSALAVNHYCIFVGAKIEFTVMLPRKKKDDPRRIEIVEGRNYVSGISWQVVSDPIPAVATISVNGHLEALATATEPGDCLVIATEDSSGISDTVEVNIFEQCDSEIALDTGTTIVSAGSCTYISAEPQMPNLQFSLLPQTSDQIKWDLTISYTRSLRDDVDYFTSTLSGNTVWSLRPLMGTKLRGGQVRVTALNQSTGCIAVAEYAIRAYNPTPPSVEAYMASLSGVQWYWQPIAKHESVGKDINGVSRYYCQFNESNQNLASCNETGVRYTPNASANGDGGFGIFQLTNIGIDAHSPPAQCLWSWKANVDTAAAELRLKRTGAYSLMQTDRQQAAQFGAGEPPGWGPVGPNNVVFYGSLASSNPIEEACAIKMYNGLGDILPGGTREQTRFCYFDDDLRLWSICDLAYYDCDEDTLCWNNYVDDICELAPPLLPQVGSALHGDGPHGNDIELQLPQRRTNVTPVQE